MADPEENRDSDPAAASTSSEPSDDNEALATPSGETGGPAATAHHSASHDLSAQLFLPSPGQRLGKYEIESILGQGGMGIVFQAWDPDLHRRVAIKILGPQLALSSTARRRFLREARAAASINHPNVLTVHAVEQHAEVPFLVMELVNGQTLKAHVAQRGPLDGIEVLRLSHQIALGLAAAHAQGVIHRDVKPGNVMLDEGGTRVRLADFGLARAAIDNLELTSQDHAVGTPAYMSPEQVRGTALDARSDLFGFGCLIHFMFTGRSPFQGRVTADTWNQILNEHPPRLLSVNPNVPPILSEITGRLLEKDPDDRYQSAADVAEELERFLALLNQASSDQIIPLLRQSHAVSRPRRRHRLLARPRRLLSVGIAVVLLISAAIAYRGPGVDSIGSMGLSINLLPPSSDPSLEEPLPGEGGPVKLKAIRVGSDPLSDCATISEALRLADQPCVITVAGPGPYTDVVDIVGPGFDQLQLIAESPVIWRCPDGATRHPLAIANVQGVTVRGFHFQIESPDAHGVEITDTAEKILLQDCRFVHRAASPKVSLLWVAAGMSDWKNRLRVKDCFFNATGRTSACIAISDGMPQGSQVEFVGCRFQALTTHLYVTDSCEQLQVKHCVFIGGNHAINLSLRKRDRNYPFLIANNTFFGVKYWLGLMDSFRSGETATDSNGGEIFNNLILGGERVQGGDDQLQHLIDHWRLEANWWERDTTTRLGADRDGRLATMIPQADLLQRSEDGEATFLVPAADSPLAHAGVGGDLPTFVGAFAPQQP